ncbi:kinesin-like protein KIN-14R isoform X1 [Juglans microcarpa x Juglans regia]|uniref:kinesin-like protein KIN-14R isoform X1 n=1 Tax=Juglans microcarpa x Juglans regia TaxID=2249226 RepID=UPI001B7EDD15|nr:kinesin-like protein KIN-14R isoform X1 [Juglans microcarpa x Juglans regia]
MDGKVDGLDSIDSVLCVAGSRLLRTGLKRSSCTDNLVMFVNAGGGALKEERNLGIQFQHDCFFQGGDVLRTDETIIESGDIPSLYQSARVGNFCYIFNNLSPGDYFVDLQFAEIINTNGPRGMRVFDVFMQEEKVLSELDIYSLVGANRALQTVDVRVFVGEDGTIVIRFEGVNGNPIVSGICIKRAAKLPASQVKHGSVICNNCAAEIEISSAQNKSLRMISTAKYEKKIAELKTMCQLKTDECHEAWMSLTGASEQLEKVQMELDDKFLQYHYLDQAMEEQTENLRDICNRYERDKSLWAAVVDDLEKKVKNMKQEHCQLSREAYECFDSIPELSKMVFAVQALVAQCDALKLKFSEEQAKRKMLYNQIQEAKGNIRVFCRCRPLRNEEMQSGFATVADFNAANDGELGILSGGLTKKIFRFDRVYTPQDGQVNVFADASPMVVSVLDGYNVCIFAFGQTGTGKTFTMEGSEQNRGVNYRILEQLFKISEERKETVTYNISISVLEVYNEQIRDLLATSPTSKKLEIRQAPEGAHHVPGIVEAKVGNIKEVWSVLQAGSNARAVGSNNVNEYSSRSHCMLCIMVKAKNLMTEECTKSKLWLVDLAGSERLAKTEVQGERLKEAQNINRSLSALGDVISALASKSSHIPYRNSKLTHLLQDSLGGDSKTLMFVQISPLEQDLGETLSSLNFATRVRGVELGPARKQIEVGELQKLKIMLDKAKQELRSKDNAFWKLEENLRNFEGKAKGKDQICRIQQEKLSELEEKIALKTQLCSQLEKQLLQLSEGVNGKEETCLSLQQKVKELENKLRAHEHAESTTLQHKVCQVKELENKLKERTQEFERHSAMLNQKAIELENKLQMEGGNQGFQMLQRKIEELELKLRQQEQQEYMLPACSADKSGTTSNERKAWSRVQTPGQMDPPSLRNSTNRAINQESVLLKGTDTLHQIRRRRGLQSIGTENTFLASSPLLDKRILSSESTKGRHIDQSKALSRLTRSTKPAATVHRAFSGSNLYKDQLPGNKDKNNKSKFWLR